MTLVRVDTESVSRYGGEAQSIFDGIHRSLVEMVGEIGAVRYHGPNATAFKAEVGRLAADFAGRMHADLHAITEIVRVATSNISTALGGQPISIRIDPRPIAPPGVAQVDFVDVDTGALESLTPRLAQQFDLLRAGLAGNLTRLDATDWEGNAKRRTVDAVARFTASARATCDEAERTITSYVRQQIELVVNADR